MKLIDEPNLRDKTHVFKDRTEAGSLLAEKLRNMAILDEKTVVLAIPAGGVPVGFMIAKGLKLPFYVFIVRKIQIPWNTEAGFGALSLDGTILLNKEVTRHLGLTSTEIEECIEKTRKIVEDRAKMLGAEKPLPNFNDKIVILVDDGLASGFTMLTAIKAVRKHNPRKAIVTTPTASLSAIRLLKPNADIIICLNIRGGPIFAVADAYKKWYDLSDEEVATYLSKI